MTLLFNALEDGTLIHQSSSGREMIQPATPVEIGDRESLRLKRFGGSSGNAGEGRKKSTSTTTSTNAAITSSSAAIKKKKVTTAASFFGATTKKTVTEKNDENSVSKAATTSTSKSNAKTNTSKTTSVSNSNKENVSNSNKNTSYSKSTTTKKSKGNADDFVGDEDEDEEFLQNEKERKERNAIREKNIAKRQSKNKDILTSNDNVESMDIDIIEVDTVGRDVKVDGDDEDDEEKEVVTGAIDAFATKKKDSNVGSDVTQKGRKRRKQVLEEKTFVDDNGFLRTETVTVWKDVEEDEEDLKSKVNDDKNPFSKKAGLPSKSSVDAKSKKVKSTKGMKQQGLSGFFAVKKK